MQEQMMIDQQMYASQGRRSMKGAVGGIQGDSPSRRYRKPYGDGKITKELLGAGDDPMARK
jgi:hypothetical protein